MKSVVNLGDEDAIILLLQVHSFVCLFIFCSPVQLIILLLQVHDFLFSYSIHL